LQAIATQFQRSQSDFRAKSKRSQTNCLAT
jgi:hypothetical protein